MKKMKEKIKYLAKYVITFLITLLLFCISLTLTSMIPKNVLEKNSKVSSDILLDQQEDDNLFRKTIILKWRRIIFDNFADAVMINNAYSINTKAPFYSAMMARRNYIEGKTEKIFSDETGELLTSSKYEAYDPILELRDTVNNDITESFEYARYWHGYLIFIRPVLTFMNISQIRILLTVILLILAVILLYKIYKNFGKATALIFLFGIIVCDYYYVGISMQGSFAFIICMIISLLLFNKKIKDKKMIFLISGALTCFFDFLTVPLISLCVPLTIYTLFNEKNCGQEYKKLYLSIISLIIIWGIGYFGTWLSKWIIVDILYNKNMIKLGIEQFIYRSSSDKNINVFSVIWKMIDVVKFPFMLAIFVTIIISIKRYIKGNQIKCDIKNSFKAGLPYLIITIIPIIWYAVLKEHSDMHYFFTYRNFFAITISICLFLEKILPKRV